MFAMNLNQKKKLAGPLLMYGMMASGYGFFMKAEGPATSTMKIILSLSGTACLLVGLVLFQQINKNSPPNGK
jgi:hypothetical protein